MHKEQDCFFWGFIFVSWVISGGAQGSYVVLGIEPCARLYLLNYLSGSFSGFVLGDRGESFLIVLSAPGSMLRGKPGCCRGCAMITSARGIPDAREALSLSHLPSPGLISLPPEYSEKLEMYEKGTSWLLASTGFMWARCSPP